MTPTPTKTFQLDDLVFAKVKGYPHWPAIVTEVKSNSKIYSVVFYGTKETGNIKSSELWSYYGYKDKFINDKTLKNPLFLKGTIEIRQAAGDDSTDEILDTSANATPKTATTESKKRKLDTLKVENSPLPFKKTNLESKLSPSPKSKVVQGSPAKSPSTKSKTATPKHSSLSPKLNKAIPDDQQVDQLVDEIHFLNKAIKLYDNLSKCDGATDFLECFEIFDDLLEINYTQILLLKNHQGFARIYRLQELQPDVTVDQRKEFVSLQENVRKARAKASFLFKKCCKVFNFSSQQKSWEEYLRAVEIFNKIPEKDRIRMTELPSKTAKEIGL
ncbi:PSIP1.2 family protein [Megaselia abdita]